MPELLDEIVAAQKRGESRGIPSICSAHPAVLDCLLDGYKPVLIEATCNQVNQFGGYTGMRAADFIKFIHQKAEAAGFPSDQLILGGDHLGPSPWQNLPAKEAMKHAGTLVQSYAEAGFTKLHIDASMKLGSDDPDTSLNLEISAQRSAALIRAAEKAVEDPSKLRYVIGSEVPIPGGAQEHETGMQVTLPAHARNTIEATRIALEKAGANQAWERVIALVVQPGVEFGSDFVLDYEPEKATGLAIFSESTPVIFEAHSTDYQYPAALKQLVRDHFGILKVGPALTFAYREAIFALAMMEEELFGEEDRSGLIQVLDKTMRQSPQHLLGHYHGDSQEVAYQRKFSLSDRARYYWNEPKVKQAVEKLMTNWRGREIPLGIARQFLPDLAEDIRKGKIENSAETVIRKKINHVLDGYYLACGCTEN
jgi:D-tagatose-1,6-bisphosphate aldolase subunit GatZ/KbaZ